MAKDNRLEELHKTVAVLTAQHRGLREEIKAANAEIQSIEGKQALANRSGNAQKIG